MKYGYLRSGMVIYLVLETEASVDVCVLPIPETWIRDISGAWSNTEDVPGTKYEDLAYATHHSFMVFGSNNGYNGTAGVAFYQNPDFVTGCAWRSCVFQLFLVLTLSSKYRALEILTSIKVSIQVYLLAKHFPKLSTNKAHHKSNFLDDSPNNHPKTQSCRNIPRWLW